MSRAQLRRRPIRSEEGFTMIEMLISTLIMVLITGAIFELVNPATGMFNTQPEVSDLQQRMRVGVDSLQRDLVMAGAGTYTGPNAGGLYNFMAPVMPYHSTDPENGVYYRADAISVLYVPPTPSQTTISAPMPPQSSEIKVNPQPNCPGGQQNQLCGFEVGMRLIIFDSSGNWDLFTVTHVQDAAAHLQHRDQDFTVGYATGANVTQIRSATYYLRTDAATQSYQLMYFDGWNTDVPVVDDVVALAFEYWGDPLPPQMIPNKPLTGPGPWTTYGPKPPALGIDVPTDTWPAGENCAFTVSGGQHASRLPVLGAGGLGQVKLTEAMLTDGPWCPDASKVNRFDADLLRVRRVRVTLRVQASKAWLRGPAGPLFKYGGTAKPGYQQVPDQEIKFDISPRNMNLGR
jgi:type II secretory pathway pseudopilin PulG